MNVKSYQDFLDKQEKIIGVIDNTLGMKVNNDSGLRAKFKVCVLFMIICYILANLFNSNFFVTLTAFLAVINIFLFTTIAEQGINRTLKISYPSDGVIKINKYILNYKQNDIMIHIKTSPTKKTLLEICGKNNTYYIKLNKPDEDKIVQFINNLIFKEKKEE